MTLAATAEPVLIPESRRPFARYADVLPNYWDRDAVPSFGGVSRVKFGSPPPWKAIQIAADRGKKTHEYTHFWDEGDLDEASLRGAGAGMRDARGFVSAWATYSGGEPYPWHLIEAPLWAEQDGVKFVAIVDRFHLSRGTVDVKSKGIRKDGTPGKRPMPCPQVSSERLLVERATLEETKKNHGLNKVAKERLEQVVLGIEWWRNGLQLACNLRTVKHVTGAWSEQRSCVYLWPDGRHAVSDYTPYNDMFDEEWRTLLRSWRESRAEEERECLSEP